MKDEKRVNKGYKIKDSVYQKAMKKSKKAALASRIEEFVEAIADGKIIIVQNVNNHIEVNI
jgi:hypothetical protein